MEFYTEISSTTIAFSDWEAENGFWGSWSPVAIDFVVPSFWARSSSLSLVRKLPLFQIKNSHKTFDSKAIGLIYNYLAGQLLPRSNFLGESFSGNFLASHCESTIFLICLPCIERTNPLWWYIVLIYDLWWNDSIRILLLTEP